MVFVLPSKTDRIRIRSHISLFHNEEQAKVKIGAAVATLRTCRSSWTAIPQSSTGKRLHLREKRIKLAILFFQKLRRRWILLRLRSAFITVPHFSSTHSFFTLHPHTLPPHLKVIPPFSHRSLRGFTPPSCLSPALVSQLPSFSWTLLTVTSFNFCFSAKQRELTSAIFHDCWDFTGRCFDDLQQPRYFER